MTQSDWPDIMEMLRAHCTIPVGSGDLLPVGRYLTAIEEEPQFAQVGAKATNCVDFNLTPIQAVRVDQEQLARVLVDQALSDRRIRHRIQPVLRFVGDKQRSEK
jgi:hypothetical protein